MEQTTDNKTGVESQKNTQQPQKSKQKPVVKNKGAEDFKKRYFEYYDDIKISDRQDW